MLKTICLGATAPVNRAFAAGTVGVAKGHGGIPLVAWRHIPSASLMNLKLPKTYDDVEFPPERRRLRQLEKQPNPIPGQKMPKMMKHLIDMRGPELVHNKLIHKQFGIRALRGGALRHGHLEMIRLGVIRKFEESRMFAVWRIDPPWKPITKKGQGHRMGGGKGPINHYVTPVKAGRIIIELGGHCEFEEVIYLLRNISRKLPFRAEVISQDMLIAEEQAKMELNEKNKNIFSFKYCLHNNFLGARSWASKYDYVWHGEHR